MLQLVDFCPANFCLGFLHIPPRSFSQLPATLLKQLCTIVFRQNCLLYSHQLCFPAKCRHLQLNVSKRPTKFEAPARVGHSGRRGCRKIFELAPKTVNGNTKLCCVGVPLASRRRRGRQFQIVGATAAKLRVPKHVRKWGTNNGLVRRMQGTRGNVMF